MPEVGFPYYSADREKSYWISYIDFRLTPCFPYVDLYYKPGFAIPVTLTEGNKEFFDEVMGRCYSTYSEFVEAFK